MLDIVFLVPKTLNSHLGLLDDLKKMNNIRITEVGKESFFYSYSKKSKFSKRVFRGVNIKKYKNPFHNIMTKVKQVVIFDTALNYISIDDLKEFQLKNPETEVNLFLINSIDAGSPTMQSIKNLVFSYPWKQIFSFDPVETEKYSFKSLGLCYYSKHDLPQNVEKDISDAYFIGGLKGGRDEVIYSLYHYLVDHGIKCNFNLMNYKNNKCKDQEIRSFSGGWIPYEKVLEGINNSKCIIEIMQQNQNGPSLRYFEAVCYNKKLLTNNPHIIKYPYYNSDNMRVFQKVEDIDVDWLKNDCDVDYNYKGEFSPVHILEMF